MIRSQTTLWVGIRMHEVWLHHAGILVGNAILNNSNKELYKSVLIVGLQLLTWMCID